MGGEAPSILFPYPSPLSVDFVNIINITNNVFAYVQDGTTHLVWLKGNGPVSNINNLNVYHAREKGMQRTQLLKNLAVQGIEKPKSTRVLEFKNDRVHVPALDTTYWCHVLKLPDYLDARHHVIQVRGKF